MIISYKCKHCGQFTIWGCRNEYDEHFCNEKCYLEYCEKHGYEPHTENLKFIKQWIYNPLRIFPDRQTGKVTCL